MTKMGRSEVTAASLEEAIHKVAKEVDPVGWVHVTLFAKVPKGPLISAKVVLCRYGYIIEEEYHNAVEQPGRPGCRCKEKETKDA